MSALKDKIRSALAASRAAQNSQRIATADLEALPGLVRLPKGVGRSREAFSQLYGRLDAARARGEGITIEITQRSEA